MECKFIEKIRYKWTLLFVQFERDFLGLENDIKIDFSKLNTLESMNLKYHDGLINLKDLTRLKELYLSSIKSNNLEFLPTLESLEVLRIINGKFISLEGLEHCKNLRKLDLRRLFTKTITILKR